MTRLIDADSLFKTIEQNDYYVTSSENSVARGMFTTGIKQAIDEQPTVYAAPVVHGHWGLSGRIENKVVEKCSVCNQGITSKFAPVYHFCPNCGAKMDEEVSE